MMGVAKAYVFLVDNQYSLNLDADKYIFEYIQNQIKKGDLRYKNNFESCNSFDDIMDKFELLLVEASAAPKKINSIYPYKELYYNWKNELICKMLVDYQIEFPKIMDLLYTFGLANKKSGAEQSKFIASYILKHHPEYADFFNVKLNIDFDAYIDALEKLENRHICLMSEENSMNNRALQYMKIVNQLTCKMHQKSIDER